ncbi:MAG TPA: hypothetical protein PLQ57_04290 [Saprospiraceae bacterium]|nr:hypothetical protein [Saprospiraceae bacterium]HRG69853.1 hypothetical protein [Saprospiraceae bacterium]
MGGRSGQSITTSSSATAPVSSGANQTQSNSDQEDSGPAIAQYQSNDAAIAKFKEMAKTGSPAQRKAAKKALEKISGATNDRFVRDFTSSFNSLNSRELFNARNRSAQLDTIRQLRDYARRSGNNFIGDVSDTVLGSGRISEKQSYVLAKFFKDVKDKL